MKRSGMLVAVLLGLAALAGCSAQQQAAMRGELTRRDIYLNLMTPEQAAKFRLLESQETDEEHLVLYCQEVGVYQKWRGVPPEAQQVIRRGRLAEGLSADEVQMAWGKAAKAEDVTSAAERQAGHQKTLWSFDYVGERDGVAAYDRQVCFLDDKLLWFKDFRDQPSPWKWKWFGRK